MVAARALQGSIPCQCLACICFFGGITSRAVAAEAKVERKSTGIGQWQSVVAAALPLLLLQLLLLLVLLRLLLLPLLLTTSY